MSADGGKTWRDSRLADALPDANAVVVGCLSADDRPCIAWFDAKALTGDADADGRTRFRTWRAAPAKRDR